MRMRSKPTGVWRTDKDVKGNERPWQVEGLQLEPKKRGGAFWILTRPHVQDHEDHRRTHEWQPKHERGTHHHNHANPGQGTGVTRAIYTINTTTLDTYAHEHPSIVRRCTATAGVERARLDIGGSTTACLECEIHSIARFTRAS